VRNDIVCGEIPREPLFIAGRRKHYSRPKSRTTTRSSSIQISSVHSSQIKQRGSHSKETTFEVESEEYSNPSIDTSRTVDSSEALYTREDIGLKYTIEDLKLAAKGKKKISVKELRAIANKWGINATVKKPDLIRYIIQEYRKRITSERDNASSIPSWR